MKKMKNDDKLVTPGEASKILNVTTATLRNWETTGKIECCRTLGKHRRYKLSQIEMILNK